MTKRTKEILARLDEAYGTEYICYLNHETPWQLLIAVILSAQCTDARVNIVTKDLFQKYDTLEKFANADLAELEQDIKSTGFYHNKAKNIISCAKSLVYEYHGEVPRTLEELTGLAGVGDKHIDLYWVLWSLNYNLKTDKYTDYFLEQYGKENVDMELLKLVKQVEEQA